MKPIVVYDDTCEMCTNFVNYLKKKANCKNNILDFVPASKIKNKQNLVENNQLEKSVHFIVNEKETFTQVHAIQEICRWLDIFPFLYRIKSPFLISFLNLLYRFVAKYRRFFLFKLLSRKFF